MIWVFTKTSAIFLPADAAGLASVARLDLGFFFFFFAFAMATNGMGVGESRGVWLDGNQSALLIVLQGPLRVTF